MSGGIAALSAGIVVALRQQLPGQCKTQRDKLALLIATILDVRSANLMALAAALPRDAEGADLRCQWISRFVANHLVVCDEVMALFARGVIAKAAASGRVVLIMDQTEASDCQQVLMLSLRFGEGALPLAWRVEATQGAISFARQKGLLVAVTPWLPSEVDIVMMGDRFYTTPDLIALATAKGWHYRLRLKGNLQVWIGGQKSPLHRHVCGQFPYLTGVELTHSFRTPWHAGQGEGRATQTLAQKASTGRMASTSSRPK